MKPLYILITALILTACTLPDATQTITPRASDTPSATTEATATLAPIYQTATACAGKADECIEQNQTRAAGSATAKASLSPTSTLQTPTPQDLRTVTPTPEVFTATPTVNTSDFDAWLTLEGITALRIRERVGGKCSIDGTIHSTIAYPRGLALMREVQVSGGFEYHEIVNGDLAGFCVATMTVGGSTRYMEMVPG